LPKILKTVDRGILQAHPLSLLEGTDSLHIDHEKAVTDMLYRCNVIIRVNNKYCLTKQENSWKIPSKVMERQRMFSTFAQGFCFL
jgi:hypothetical protein